MQKLVLSGVLIITGLVNCQAFAQTVDNTALIDNTALYVSAVKNIQKTMPSKVTIDGKRIYSVNSDHICSITVTMSSSRQYQFSLLTWPDKGQVDDSGYTEFILKDTDNKPHILRTDQVKGKQFLANMSKLIKNCQESTKKNKITNS
ncbi:hypothetical protein HK18_05345 [Commensalibacter intestini]|uniref:DUF4468 domain-containing protein n=2 Tax=Commensalibacter intestini TaxID=479936 RepID=A0A251ZVY2_9PROT|nr:hypothetical protein [Commensalibacter intestini]OUI78830.1 hypothetical protein HK18_05345 [Commensalibacter intestini]